MKYRFTNNTNKYRSTIQVNKHIMKQKLARIAKDITKKIAVLKLKEAALLKSKAEADKITMMMDIMRIIKS